MNRTPIAICLSGRGSNYVALEEAVDRGTLSAEILLVASDNPEAPGLERARERGRETLLLPYRPGAGDPPAPADRAERIARAEALLAEALEDRGVRWVVLAGFMRVLSPAFVRRFPRRIVNLHPALLPSFPGTRGIRDAYDHGVRLTGVTVHLVDEGIDTGPILAQEAIPVTEADTPESLAARIHALEHRLFPETLAALFEGRLAPLERTKRSKG